MRILISSIVVAMGLAGGAVLANQNPQNISAENDITRVEDSNVAEVEFKAGTKNLAENEKQEVDRLIAGARAKGQIDQVKVLAWSDHEYPAKGAKATRQDKELADGRSQALKSYLKSRHGLTKIDLYNMAERPGALDELFSTSEAQVKAAAESGGKAPSEKQLDILRTNQRSSTALVLVQLK